MAERDYSKSKFDSRLTELLWELSLDGGPDEQAGDASEGLGWAGILRGGAQLGQALDADSEYYGLTRDDEALVDSLEKYAGAILYEDTQGFVSSDLYEDGDELEERWERIEKELSTESDEDFDTDVPSDEYLGNARRNAGNDRDRIPSAKEWFGRFPDLGKEPLFTIRFKLGCGNMTIRAWEGPEFSAVGSGPTHTRLFCEMRGCGVRFPRENYYVGIPRHSSIDGKDAKESVMALFAMKPGDTDEEFFAEYTPAQLDFVEQHGEEIYMIKLERYGEG